MNNDSTIYQNPWDTSKAVKQRSEDKNQNKPKERKWTTTKKSEVKETENKWCANKSKGSRFFGITNKIATPRQVSDQENKNKFKILRNKLVAITKASGEGGTEEGGKKEDYTYFKIDIYILENIYKNRISF